MIISEFIGNVSPIILSVMLIAYLILYELGNNKIKHSLRPFVTVLAIVFFIMAGLSIFATYSGIK